MAIGCVHISLKGSYPGVRTRSAVQKCLRRSCSRVDYCSVAEKGCGSHGGRLGDSTTNRCVATMDCGARWKQSGDAPPARPPGWDAPGHASRRAACVGGQGRGHPNTRRVQEISLHRLMHPLPSARFPPDPSQRWPRKGVYVFAVLRL